MTQKKSVVDKLYEKNTKDIFIRANDKQNA